MYKILLLLLFAFQVNAEEIIEDEFSDEKDIATIQVLDKITAKLKYLDISVGEEVDFGNLRIHIASCWKSSPYELSENKILLYISEKKPGKTEYKYIFRGWMFSSSPAISSLEHAIYDVTAIDCHD